MGTGRIVVGVDGSEEAQTALEWAADEARLRGARLEVVYVYDYTPAYELYEYPVSLPAERGGGIDREQAAGHARGLVERMAAPYERDLEVEALAVEDRRPARALVQQAAGADLLVVGSRGRGGFAGLVLGSVSQQCLQHATCPVAVIPTPSR